MESDPEIVFPEKCSEELDLGMDHVEFFVSGIGVEATMVDCEMKEGVAEIMDVVTENVSAKKS